MKQGMAINQIRFARLATSEPVMHLAFGNKLLSKAYKHSHMLVGGKSSLSFSSFCTIFHRLPFYLEGDLSSLLTGLWDLDADLALRAITESNVCIVPTGFEAKCFTAAYQILLNVVEISLISLCARSDHAGIS